MSISQISVFVENQPGRLKRVLDAFEAQGINVRGFSASDTGDYGIVRFILDEPQRGLEVLKGIGCATALSEVLCVRLKDTPGELARVVGIISELSNIIYSYSLVSTFTVFYVEDVAALEAVLVGKSVDVATQTDLQECFSKENGHE
ncbi:MAG: ACT domain-containing protein [Eggerthellaceae bacterium]|nr:ACT domain-containing protein [Eggerthellaceae bacterium]